MLQPQPKTPVSQNLLVKLKAPRVSEDLALLNQNMNQAIAAHLEWH
ncbi:hypothetical protein NIES4075_53150 [Tolypothrix sp. NIES-4075]|nr:hypothetical protein NIES4075_53150 [Tolypothrix sp. NIES-4075]